MTERDRARVAVIVTLYEVVLNCGHRRRTHVAPYDHMECLECGFLRRIVSRRRLVAV